eukprot:TRINITY_DN75245_c0_g1_i1.p1 TRINITY_DN75245_c0_g1~~TRINITY_DN75245_c0_g1_i1.p1  ORF type:complete len:458 (-),score=87.12 TRINITY_DN75245_c0_g1_i1:51-1424(-)
MANEGDAAFAKQRRAEPWSWAESASLASDQSPLFMPQRGSSRRNTPSGSQMKQAAATSPVEFYRSSSQTTDAATEAWVVMLWRRIDRDNSGFITRKELECDEFTNLMKTVIGGDERGGGGASYSRSSMNMREAIQLCLRKADTNSDGKLSFEEFRAFMANLREAKNSKAHLIFSLFDLDANGYIDREEFVGLIRYFLGHNPTQEQLECEWLRLLNEGDGYGGQEATKSMFFRWLRTSEITALRVHAPPLTPPAKSRSMGSLGSPGHPRRSTCKPLSQCPKWIKHFTSGLDKGHVNDVLPKGRRTYFSKAQSDGQLRRFFSDHEGFEKQIAVLDEGGKPPPEPRCALFPSVLSSAGGTPMTLPGRHNPGGTMRDNATKQISRWEDNFVLPLRYRCRSFPGYPNAYYRPLADRATFSEPDRLPPARQRRGLVWPPPTQQARSEDEVKPTRLTTLEAIPW